MKERHRSSIFACISKLLFASQLSSIFRRFVFSIISVGPIPNHISFIMDGNRRFAKKEKLDQGSGYNAGYSTLMSKLSCCYELGVKYISVYAFSIDNFKRKPDEVQALMDLILEKIKGMVGEDNFANKYGVRVYFIGDLKLLNEPVRIAAKNVMQATANNTKGVLLVCIAYTSTNEIVYAVEESCAEKRKEIEQFNSATTSNDVINEFRSDIHNVHNSVIKVVDIEKHLYMSVAPDLMIRTSGETRLSNFLLWQTSNCQLYSPNALWPEISLWHVLWGIIIYQRNHDYLEKKKKQA